MILATKMTVLLQYNTKLTLLTYPFCESAKNVAANKPITAGCHILMVGLAVPNPTQFKPAKSHQRFLS